MPKKTLVIDGGDRDHFFLAIDAGTLQLGETPGHPGGVVRGLRVVRVHCEVEVEDDGVGVRIDAADDAAPPRDLARGAAVLVSRSRLKLTTDVDSPTPVPGLPAVAAPAAPAPTRLRRRLVVIDGANQGQFFKLPAAGSVVIGRGGKETDIGLDDLLVARIHCRLTVDADGVTVTHLEGGHGTLVDGRRIERPEPLRPGSTLRIGNSHLRLEARQVAEAEAEPSTSDSGILRTFAASKMDKPAAPPDPVARLEGQVLGHYKLGPVLGRGFTAAVYKAADVKTEQVVALKVFADGFPASAAEMEQFSRGFREVLPARHPNLVAPLGAGKSGAHGWVAREYVDGEGAADVIARIHDGEKPSWTRAARVAVHLARALDVLHQLHLVHGNISPRNVLIRTSDQATKLADLGLLAAIDGSRLQAGCREKKRTAELAFLAPEQTEPGAFVDGLADLYAIGAVAYTLATGRPPVTGKSREEVLDGVRLGRIAKPSSLYKKIPAAFEGVVMKLLARNQEDRYRSPAALLEDLEPLAQMHDIKL